MHKKNHCTLMFKGITLELFTYSCMFTYIHQHPSQISWCPYKTSPHKTSPHITSPHKTSPHKRSPVTKRHPTKRHLVQNITCHKTSPLQNVTSNKTSPYSSSQNNEKQYMPRHNCCCYNEKSVSIQQINISDQLCNIYCTAVQ